jgi:hypothetical protein
MRTCHGVLLLVCAALQGAFAQGVETSLVARITSLIKQPTYRVMTPEDYNTLKEDLQAEAKLLPEALRQVEADWRVDNDLKQKPFPNRTLFAARTATIVTSCPDRAQATNKKLALEQEAAGRAAKNTGTGGSSMVDNQLIADGHLGSLMAMSQKNQPREEASRLLRKASDRLKVKLEELKQGGDAGQNEKAPAADSPPRRGHKDSGRGRR